MPDWLSVILLGLIEGLTEFIPVSSTGHLLIAEEWFPVAKTWSKDSKELFTIVIQSGAALALIPLFWKKITGMLFRFKEPQNRDLLVKLSTAFLITCVVGMVLKKMGLELPESARPVAWATLIGGFVILAIEAWSKKRVLSETLTWPIVMIFAVGQIVAMLLPGASRSGSTIMFALAMGLARPVATEFSFLLGVPTLLAAGAYEIMKHLKDGAMGDLNYTHVALGFIAAAISAFVVVRWLIKFVQSHTFTGFAIYRIVLGAALLLWFV
jgi:undecaprenyl-diphosphatase